MLFLTMVVKGKRSDFSKVRLITVHSGISTNSARIYPGLALQGLTFPKDFSYMTYPPQIDV